jgi:hypothetical protein
MRGGAELVRERKEVKEKTGDLRNSSRVAPVRRRGWASFARSIRSRAIGMTKQGTPNPRGRGKRRPYKRGSNPRGRGEPLPYKGTWINC